MNRTRSRIQIPRQTIDEIQTRSDIVEVISECGVPLRPAGRDYKALCPFHDEKTPSFTVSVEKQIFYCFGCETGGNVISFVQKHEGKSFIETVTWLADRLNISLPSQDVRESANRKRFTSLEELNRFAVQYYHRELLTENVGEQAMRYLRHRGVQPKTLRLFQLGYARNARRNLVKIATEEGWTIQQLVDAGLIKNEERGPQDRFWNRLLFPIQNERGVPVGFGGRALSEERQPKYLNSPETLLYHKSNVLYNLDKARQAIYRKGSALLVEGYMDALMLYQHGVENVAAVCGTSLSENHAGLLKRFAPEVIMVYDGDIAGLQAAQRGLHRLLEEGLRVRIALLPNGEDPDSFARQHGAEAFTELTDKAINLIEFQIQTAIQQENIHRVDVKTQIVKEISTTLMHLQNRLERSEYVKYAARELHVNEGMLWHELRERGIKEATAPYRTRRDKAAPKKLSPRAQIESQLIEALIQNPAMIPYIKTQLHYADLTEPHFVQIAQLLWEASADNDSLDIQNLLNKCPDEKLRAFISNALLRKMPPNLQARVDGCLKKLRHFILKDTEQRVRSHALAEGVDELETLQELLELSAQRRALAAQPLHEPGAYE